MADTANSPHADPDDLYSTPPPWDIGRPQPAFRALADAGAVTGRVLDAGCGTGEHALMAAGLGLDATGIDLAATAIRLAEGKARDRGLTARFAVHDVLRLADLDGPFGGPFDTVLDCGLFHLFDDAERAAYLAGLRAVLRPGGRYLMLGFSDRQPGEWGRVRKLTLDEITAAFADGWRIDSLAPATLEVTLDPPVIHGWLLEATRC